MQSIRSIDYFRSTLNSALNYFARKQKNLKKTNSNQCSIENNDDDLIEIFSDDTNDIPTNEPNNSLHNSYKLFYKRLPPTVVRDVNIKQGRVREYYKRTFDNGNNKLPKPIIQLNSSNNKLDNLVDNDIQEAFQHDLENNFEVMDENDDDENENHLHLLQRIIANEDDDEQFLNDSLQQITIEQQQETIHEESPTIEDEQQSIVDESPTTPNDTQHENIIDDKEEELHENLETSLSVDNPSINDIQSSTELHPSKENSNKSSCSSPIDIKTKSTTTDNGIGQLPSAFTSPIELEQIIDNEQSTSDKNAVTNNSTELFYDFRPENFHAEQGAPYVCTTCNGIGHLKSECPELIIPNMIDLPAISEQWIQILSRLCRQITDRFKPKNNDVENRRQILSQLEKQFQIDYPDCNLYAFGSYYNGFGFCQSDLDVCIVFNDEREQNNDEVIRIMQKILRAMKSSNTFDDVQPILQAKVPIIRTRHRQWHIAIDISLHNMLAIENTRLLKTYTKIDPRVSQLGYMIKHLAKLCYIGDASRGTLSSYAYIIMLIHFLQQIQPPVLPVLQKKDIWKNENKLSTGALWIEFLRFYTEQFNYEEHIVTIRQIEPLLKCEKGWFRQTIAIEDPFELSHNLAGGLSPRNWIVIRRVFIRARQQFGVQPEHIDISNPDMLFIEALRGANNDLEKQVNTLKRQLEAETLLRIDLENKNKTLREELQFNEQVHETAIEEIRKQKHYQVKTYDDGLRQQYDDRLLNELQELRMQTEQEMQAMRDEIASQYEKKIEDLQTTIRRNADQFGTYRSDVVSYRERIEDVTKTRDALNDKVLSLEQRCRDLEDRLHRSQQRQDELLVERDNDIERLKQQIEQMQIDYQNLLDIKIGLDREISTYRKLLESEEERLNISGNLSRMEGSSMTATTTGTFESSSYPSRKRPRYELDDQPSMNTQLLDGINIIDDESSQPKFVKLINHSKQDVLLNGWILKRKVGSQSYEFKFPKGMVLKAGATTTIWSSDVNDISVDPPTNLKLRTTKWFTSGSESKKTILEDSEGRVIAEKTVTIK
ncbi:unnamed protein product [Rotaria sp. Silwood2]|nr:unnamed protein product [Rotaria sp. Silwood2]